MKYIFVLLFYFIPFLSFAHPHVFIDNRIEVVFDEKGLKGFNHEWTFDEMFSSTIIQEFDLNADDVFGEDEIKEVEKGAFSNLKEYDYFTDIKINGRQFKIQLVKDFYAKIDSGVMVYEFFIPCEVTGTLENQEVVISVFDPTYFVQVLLASEAPFSFFDTLNVEFSHEVFEDEENSYYYGQIVPEALKVKFRKKT
jgi:ABC-type uncharacterized transport system substrate-binding protein